MKQEELFLDWLLTGVYHKAINERNAHQYYEQKYGKIEKQKFVEKMYEIRNSS